MNRLVVLGVVGWIVFAGLGGCQGPDPFDRSAHGGSGGKGGHTGGGLGGSFGSGGSGFGSGGSGFGSGGFRAGLGGSGFGGSSMGGHGMGGASGAAGTGAGGAGMGGHAGSGAGGRTFDAGQNCVTTIVNAGYMATGAPPCSACMDQNHTSFDMNCRNMIDCMAAQPQPCSGNCELECFNKSSGSGPLMGCVDAILMAGGCE